MKNGLRDVNGSLSKLNVENFILPHLNAKTRIYKGYDLEDEEMNDDEMSEEEDTEIDKELYEGIKILVMAVQAIIHVVNELRVFEAGRQLERPLSPR
ncbi:hypothetical protein Dsin_018548 [Dipteronia sinensis]|uniref:Uncharacterized protein n=1 Tax=Dipteronia sinensis TaxID=43782 RepID=A0AAE0A637_9ROSI|nr:hypothetical protein Dsin_018548 [Dipteronia sinensis]